MDEQLKKRLNIAEKASLLVIIPCTACGVKQEIPYRFQEVSPDHIAAAIFDILSLMTIDGIDLLLCAGCKHSTSLTDLRAIAGRVRREAEKKQ